MVRQTHYSVLRIPEDATPAKIRHAFRALVRQYHPDAGAGSSAEKFHGVVEAYEILSDPRMRRDYDAALAQSRRRHLSVPEPLIPVTRKAEQISESTRYQVEHDPFDLLDQVLDEFFEVINSNFTFRGW
jgi:DnaJ-class molecular chaperone